MAMVIVSREGTADVQEMLKSNIRKMNNRQDAKSAKRFRSTVVLLKGIGK